MTESPLSQPDIARFELAWLAITYACNNWCVWCYAAAGGNEKQADYLDFVRVAQIVELLHTLDVKKVALIGGEPTLHPQILDIVRALVSRQIRVNIVTNGRRFQDMDFTRRMRDAGLKNAGFSIEGPCRQIHDAITRANGSFQETVAGVGNAVSAGIGTYSNTTICPQNIEHLIRIAEFATSLDVRSVNFNICGPCVSRKHSHAMSPRIAAKAYEHVYRHLRAKGVTTRLLTATPLCNFDPLLRAEMKKDRAAHGGPCQLAHGRNFVVDFNGDVLPCTHLTGFPMFNIFGDSHGVITKEEFVARYNNPHGLASQFRHGMKRYASARCERDNCSERCAGGCPLFWTHFNPDEEIAGSCHKSASQSSDPFEGDSAPT